MKPRYAVANSPGPLPSVVLGLAKNTVIFIVKSESKSQKVCGSWNPGGGSAGINYWSRDPGGGMPVINHWSRDPSGGIMEEKKGSDKKLMNFVQA